AANRLGAFGRARSATSLTRLQPGNSNLGLQSNSRFFENEIDIISEVRPAARPGPAAGSTSEDISHSEHVEQVFEAGESLTEPRARGGARTHSGVAEAIVPRSEFGLREYLVRFV